MKGNGESMREQELSRPRLTRSVDEACHVLWNGVAVGVTARAAHRYAWTTVSIDVAVDATTISRTGGVFKFVGTRVEVHARRQRAHGGTRLERSKRAPFPSS